MLVITRNDIPTLSKLLLLIIITIPIINMEQSVKNKYNSSTEIKKFSAEIPKIENANLCIAKNNAATKTKIKTGL